MLTAGDLDGERPAGDWFDDDEAQAVSVLDANDSEADVPEAKAGGASLARRLALPGVTTAAEIATNAGGPMT